MFPCCGSVVAEESGGEQILQKSHRGFFTGILVLSGGFVAIIMFYFSTDETVKTLIYMITLISLHGIMLLATGVAILKVNQVRSTVVCMSCLQYFYPYISCCNSNKLLKSVYIYGSYRKINIVLSLYLDHFVQLVMICCKKELVTCSFLFTISKYFSHVKTVGMSRLKSWNFVVFQDN